MGYEGARSRCGKAQMSFRMTVVYAAIVTNRRYVDGGMIDESIETLRYLADSRLKT